MNTLSHWDVVVVGAGAAGLVAAERAASRGRKTLLVERNRKPGVKILMSGGTRCNLTHATDARGIVSAYGPPGRFLHSALAALGPADLVALVEDEGVLMKTEETGKIFPVSNKAMDILAAFMARLRRTSCELSLGDLLKEIERDGERFRLITAEKQFTAEKVVITTGGQSYPGCGTTGDGYRWATQLGHTLVPPRPALVPITTSSEWARALSGITIPDVVLRLIEPPTEGGARQKPRLLDTRRGSMLFTHVGLSGPVVLDISRNVTGHPRPATLHLECDFLPNERADRLEEQLRQQATSDGKKRLPSLAPEPLPRRLAEALVGVAGLSVDGKAGESSKAGRGAMVRALKQAPISVTGTLGFAKAEVTAGGIPLGEVDSRDMQSKIAPGLYLAGEVLDLDGPIGGYNFQAAFSTGWLAGLSV